MPHLYFAVSLATVVSEPDLYRLLTFRVPNLMSLFLCLISTKGSVQARGNKASFYGEELLAPRPNPKLEDHTNVRLLILYIRIYHSYRRPFLLPQPDDAPFQGNMDQLIMENASLNNP